MAYAEHKNLSSPDETPSLGKRVKSMKVLRRTTATVVLVAGVVMGCRNGSTTNSSADGGRCDLGAHKWKQASPGPCAESFWRFTPAGNGSWKATETGCANATGTATYDGATIRFDFQYDDGNSGGRYEWPVDSQCRGTTGKVSWTKGPLAGQSAPSTLAIAP